jgi:hypothetical protein
MGKHILILTAIFLSVLAGVKAQDKGLNSLENGKTTQSADDANRIFIAYQSAKYGRAYKSPDALIFAASILKQIPSDKVLLDKQIEGGQPDTVQKNNKANQTADIFLKEARTLAKKDRNLIGRINTVSKMIPDRGALGGPKRASTEVKAYATDVITVRFKGGENAVIAVSGDGDTDLDLYVYDENGNLVGADTNGLDDCKVRFFPKWTGTFKIKVKNLGNVYNRYLLVTN